MTAGAPPADAESGGAGFAWRVVLALAGLHFLLHMVTAGHYGIFRDEYYYLACARRLAWGYVDHPPLSIALLAGVQSLLGDGVLALRLVPALCGAALVVLVARLAALLGGGRFAQGLAALAMAAVSVVQVLTGFYSMNALDVVFWTLAWGVVARWVLEPRPHRLLALGVVLGLGLLNKIGLLVFGAAFGLALLATPQRRALATPWPWLAGVVAFALFLPYLVWQQAHGWPTLEFIANAQREKIALLSPLAFLGEVVLEQQPATLLVWGVGLAWLLLGAGGRLRLLGLMVVVGFALLLVQTAKPYYAAGLFPVLLAAGACAWERWTRRPSTAWLRPALVAGLAVAGLVLLPFGMPVLPVAAFARWQAWIGIAPQAAEIAHTTELPQHYADRFGWEELAARVGEAVAALPPAERARAVIFTRNYGEAGALEYWAARYGLPPVVCAHNNYWLWAPPELALDTVIVVGGSEADLREAFGEVQPAGVFVHRWAPEHGRRIWVARKPKRPYRELLAAARRFV